MQAQTQFDRLSTWLKGQFRSAERVTVEHGSATFQVATAEYELRCLRRDLAEIALEPGAGLAALALNEPLAPMSHRKHPVSQATHAPATKAEPPAPTNAPIAANFTARSRTNETTAATNRSAKLTQTLSQRLRNADSNAA